MITENYKNRIKCLAGVLTEGNEDKLKNLGVREDVAKALTKIDEKLSLFLANILTQEYAKQEDLDGDNIKEFMLVVNQNDFLRFIEENKGKINYIIEWIKSPFRVGELNLKEIKDLSQAFEMAEQWHNTIEDTGIIDDESGEIVKSYPMDGLYWIDLKTNESEAEGNAMGHCGRDSSATTLFSLRDTKKSPHVTIAYNSDTKTVTQVKGRKNKKPLPQYMKYVYDFLSEMVKQRKLEHFKWSYKVDLDDEDIEYIFQNNMDVYVNGILKRNLESNIYKTPSFSSEEIASIAGKEVYAKYVKELLQKNIQNPSFNLTMKRGDIINAIGDDGFKQYVNDLIDKAISSSNFKIPFSRAEILKYVGDDKYNEYIDSILSGVLENPTKNRVNMERDELFALLGEAKYKEFISELIKKLVESVNTERSLKYMLNQHNINIEIEKVRSIVGNKPWFFFLKRSLGAERSNIGAY